MLQAVESKQTSIFANGAPVNAGPSVTIGGASALYREWTHSAFFAAAPRSDGNPCNPTTASTLDALGFKAGQIRAVNYGLRATRTNGGNNRLQGINAWVTFNDQPGYLVVSLNPTCQLMTYYTRAGAQLPNNVLAAQLLQ